MPSGTGAQAPAPPAGAAPARDDLFNQVFGQRRSTRPRRLDLPAVLDGREIGLVKAELTGDARATVDLSTLAGLLEPVAAEEALTALRAAAGADGFGRPADLPPDGITLRIDEADLQLQVTLPPTLRRMVRLEVQRRGELARGYMLLPPADLSAYVNARAAIDYRSGDGPPGAARRGPLGVAFEPALNFRGWVLEGDAFYQERAERRWSRGPTRLVRDFPASSLRFQAGDVVPPSEMGQTGRALGGVSLSRNFSLQPYQSVQPTGQRQFILEAPSSVEVRVNGRPTRTFRLGAGPYDLTSLPGTSGANDVEIRITDAFGREETIRFPFFFDSQLLATGVSQFAFTAGYPSAVRRGVLHYDTGLPTFSGFHRQGVTDQLTLGAGLQADRRQQNLSGELLFTTRYGTFALEPAASFGPAGDGLALAARYRNYMRGDEVWRNRTVTAQLGWRDGRYVPFGVTAGRNDVGLDAAARISQPITPDLVGTLGGRWRGSRNPLFQDSYAADLSLRYRIGRGDSLDVTFNHGRGPDGDVTTGIFASLRFSIGDGRQAAGASVDTAARERRLDWRYQSLAPVDSWSLSLDATNRPGGGNRLQGSAGYTHQRFLVSARHDLAERLLGAEMQTESRTQLSAATALAFADGHVAVTRPITNSFAIVVPHPRLAGRIVGVDPIGGRYLAETDWLGPPVVPNISPYLIRPVLLDVPDVPLGYDLGNDRPAVEPGYRTGTLVPIGTDASVSLDGTLQGSDGAPLALQSGVLRPLPAGRAADIPFFTNRRGRFRIDSVRSGRWELVLHGREDAPLPVEVPPEAEGILQLGTVQLR